MINRYAIGSQIPQPIRKVLAAHTDLIHTLKQNERLDNIAFNYYGDAGLSWVIMCANPQWDNEFEIPAGAQVRVPYPLDRILNKWSIEKEV